MNFQWTEKRKVIAAGVFGLLVAVAFALMPAKAALPTINIFNVDSSVNFSNLLGSLPASDSLVRMEAGNYVVTSSPWPGSIVSGTNLLCAKLVNKTNVTIMGVPGRTFIDGSGQPGDQLLITNCSGIRIHGVTFIGWTNHNITQTPSYQVAGTLWDSVVIANSENVTFEKCRWERHHDQGIVDGATYTSAVPFSTNQILITDCSFEDIGGWRTNNPSSNFQADGCAIGPTGWVINRCVFKNCLRGIEPFFASPGFNGVFYNLTVKNCTAVNMVDFFLGPASATNAHYALIEGNTVLNEAGFSYHGTNFVTTPNGCNAFYITGGKGWQVLGNSARGNMSGGFYFANSASFLDDFTVIGNVASDIGNVGGSGGGFTIGDASADSAANASSVRRSLFKGNRAHGCYTYGFALYAGRDITFEDNYGFRPSLQTTFSDGQGGRLGAGMRVGLNNYTVNKITNLVLRGNVLVDGGVTAPFGFAFENSVQSCINENNMAIGFAGNNGFTNAAGSAVTTVGPPRTFSASIDLPSIGVAAQFTTNFTATGVTTNDVVQIAMPAQFYASGNTTNLIYNAWGSNDLVYIKFANNDAVTAADAPQVRMVAIVRAARIHGE